MLLGPFLLRAESLLEAELGDGQALLQENIRNVEVRVEDGRHGVIILSHLGPHDRRERLLIIFRTGYLKISIKFSAH